MPHPLVRGKVAPDACKCRTPGGELSVRKAGETSRRTYWKEARQIFDDLLLSLQPATVEGLPLEWVVSRSEDAVTLLVANHDEAQWVGNTTLRDVPGQFQQCTNAVTGAVLKCVRQDDASVRFEGLSVLPWDVVAAQVHA